MKHVGTVLRENSWLCWLFRIVIVTYWILVPTGLYLGLQQQIRTEIRYQKAYDPRVTQRHTLELAQLVGQLVKQAEKDGRDYSPERYFADLRTIYTARNSYRENPPIWPHQVMHQLRFIVDENLRNGYFTASQVSVASSSFADWNNYRLGDAEEARRELKAAGWRKMVSWLMLFYLQSVMLAILIYLLRMVEREGIRQTIAENKLRFVLASIGWVFYIFKYPYSVVKELRVEAELRRLGNLFRRLERTERSLVRGVAASPEYKGWISAYRQQHAGSFQRGLLVALLGALMCCVFPPFFVTKANAEAKSLSKADTAVIGLERDGSLRPTIVSVGSNDNTKEPTSSSSSSPTGFASDFPATTDCASPAETVWLVWSSVPLLVAGPPKDISHVPISGYLVLFST